MTAMAVHPFLIGLLRGAEPEGLLPLARTPTDWEEIVRDAAANGLTPLLYRWLKQSDMERRLPVSAASRLEGQCFGLAARTLLLSAELGCILRALEEQEVVCAPLRGLALAERLYGDITARPMGDLDVLVHKEDLARVAATLRELGFQEMDRRPGFARAFSYTLEFFKDRHGCIVVEPHWTIAYPPFVDRLDMEKVWRRCTRRRVVGVESWDLGPEDLLLHLCLHLAHRDGTAPLLWFYEVDRLVRQEQEALDWSRLSSLAYGASVQPLLSQALGTVRALLGTPIPDGILDRPTPDPGTSREGRLARLVGEASRVDGKESLALLFTLRGFRARLRYALALLFPTPEFMRIEYGLTHTGQLGWAYFRRVSHFSREGLKGVMRFLF